jgi:hypothetical protein
MVPARFRTYNDSNARRKRFFQYRLQFYRHSLLDRWNSLEFRPFRRIFLFSKQKKSTGPKSGE